MPLYRRSGLQAQIHFTVVLSWYTWQQGLQSGTLSLKDASLGGEDYPGLRFEDAAC